MKNSLRILLSAVLLTISIDQHAQPSDPFSFASNIIPSLQSYQVSRYGNVTPSLYTGAMNFEVPLYTYSDPDFNIPISIQYHYDGYKPSMHSGSVGLGWTLNCGGVITREIVGLPDDYNRSGEAASDSEMFGYYYSARDNIADVPLATGQWYNASHCTCQTTPYAPEGDPVSRYFGSSPLAYGNISYNYYGGAEGNGYDPSSDVYHFSFLGISGDFIIKPDGSIKVFNSTIPEGEIEIMLQFQAFFVNGTVDTQITINTADGYCYVFGGDKEFIDYSLVKHISGLDNDSDPNRWCFSALHLRQVTAPNGRCLTFDRSSNPIVEMTYRRSFDYYYVRKTELQSDWTHFIFGTPGISGSDWRYESVPKSVINTISRPLQSISIDGHTLIQFRYEDKTYNEYGFNAFSSLSADQYQSLLPTIETGSINGGQLTNMGTRLQSIAITDMSGMRVDSISFRQNYSSSSSGYSPKMFLTSVDGNFGRFAFGYFHGGTSDLYPSIDCENTDHWGYWKGSGGSVAIGSAYDAQISSLYNLPNQQMKSPDTLRTRYGTLTDIFYPTGGCTRIEYEQNRVSQRLDVSLLNQDGYSIAPCDDMPVGGVRVKRIISTASPVGSFSDITGFDYGDSGTLLKMPRYGITIDCTLSPNTGALSGSEYESICLLNNDGLPDYSGGGHIGYSRVTVRYNDGSCDINEFSDYSVYPDRYLHDDLENDTIIEKTFQGFESAYDAYLFYRYYAASDSILRVNAKLADVVVSDRSVARGRLLGRTTLSASGDTLKKERHCFHLDSSITSDAIYNAFTNLIVSRRRHCYARLDSVIVTDYFGNAPISTSTAYTYNAKGQKTSETMYSSAGRDVHKRLYSYCHETDSAAPAGNLAAVATTRSDGGGQDRVTSLTRFSYDASRPTLPSWKREYSIDNPYQSASVFDPQQGAGYRQTSYSYNDIWRPSRIVLPGGAYFACAWDASGRYPTSLEENGPENVTEYQWQDMVGMSHRYLPTHLHEYYTYDSRGRLHTVSNAPSDSLFAYSYHLFSDDGEGCANFISKKVLHYPGIVATGIDYYDGLGYPVQSVEVDAGSDGLHVVTPHWTDPMRRSGARVYLPYPSPSADYDADALSAQDYWYMNRFGSWQVRNYTETSYETSPAGRPVSRRLPGAEYADHPDEISYRLNADSDNVFDISYVYGDTPAFRTGASYRPEGTLRCTTTTDADGRTTMSFTDPFGQPVLERRRDGDVNVDTYFVHDLRDSLVCVIQPEGSAMLALNTTYSYDLSSPLVERHCFLCQYDGKGRLIRSRRSGAGWEDFACDERGRVVFSRDAVMAASGRWIYNEYDCYDRLTAKYLIQSPASISQIRWIAAYAIDTIPEDVLANVGAADTALLESHSYDVEGYGASTPAPVPSYLAFVPATSSIPGVGDTAPASRLSTSLFRQYYEKMIVLPSDEDYSNPQYVERAIYYDNMGRVLQTVEKNAQGGITRDSWNYDWQGTVLSRHSSVTMGSASRTVLKVYEQDARGRIGQERTYIDGCSSPVTTVLYTYDVLGRQNAVVEGYFVQARHYDLRGWTDHTACINGDEDVFTEYLRYDSPAYTAPSFTGNVAERYWLQGDLTPQTYSYAYDNLGRLSGSTITYGGLQYNGYTERDIAYDLNGNITALKRYGSSSAAASDDLSYTYDGNRISSVNGQTYGHDANGNVTIDSSHGTQASYNLLNLPRRVEDLQSGDGLNYAYLADGTKAAMTDDDGTGYAYAGDMVFARSPQGTYSFESVAYGNGRIEGASNTVRRYVTDHLGNVRAIVTGNSVVERNDYYPFGGRHPRNTLPVLSANRWRLGAKESQPSLTGSLVDFGARMYDPHTGRWTTQDPMAWKYLSLSPYNYCGNNPVNLVDPDGMDTKIVVSNHRIKYQAVIYIYGEDASKKLARSIGRKINDAWQNTNPTIIEGREVKFNVKVRRLKKSTEFIPPNQYSNIMEISSERGGVIDSNHGRFSYDSCVHEFGHMIGLKDRYHNVTVDGSTYSEPDVGYEGTIMAEPSCMGTVTQDDVIKSFRLVLPGQISNGVYFIDKHNNEKSN